MNPAATQRETLEVFCYTFPKVALAFFFSAFFAACIAILIVYAYLIPCEPFTEWFSQLLGSRQIPVAAVLGIYGLGGLAIVRLTRDWLTRLSSRPTLVAERSGLTTEWSGQLAWNDIDGFTRGTRVYRRNPIRLQYVCAVVPDVQKYSLSWSIRGRIGIFTISVMEPANAVPLAAVSPAGYYVRRNGLDPLVHLDTRSLMAELDDFRTRIRDKGGQ
jgi:hypothetical protein